jgi:hypothetical protein
VGPRAGLLAVAPVPRVMLQRLNAPGADMKAVQWWQVHKYVTSGVFRDHHGSDREDLGITSPEPLQIRFSVSLWS